MQRVEQPEDVEPPPRGAQPPIVPPAAAPATTRAGAAPTSLTANALRALRLRRALRGQYDKALELDDHLSESDSLSFAGSGESEGDEPPPSDGGGAAVPRGVNAAVSESQPSRSAEGGGCVADSLATAGAIGGLELSSSSDEPGSAQEAAAGRGANTGVVGQGGEGEQPNDDDEASSDNEVPGASAASVAEVDSTQVAAGVGSGDEDGLLAVGADTVPEAADKELHESLEVSSGDEIEPLNVGTGVEADVEPAEVSSGDEDDLLDVGAGVGVDVEPVGVSSEDEDELLDVGAGVDAGVEPVEVSSGDEGEPFDIGAGVDADMEPVEGGSGVEDELLDVGTGIHDVAKVSGEVLDPEVGEGAEETAVEIAPGMTLPRVLSDEAAAAARQALASEEAALRTSERRAAANASGLTEEVVLGAQVCCSMRATPSPAPPLSSHVRPQELMRAFGVPYIVAPFEAESQCAQLEMAGQTAGTITDDSDIFLFGGNRVVRRACSRSKHAELYTAAGVRRVLGPGRTALVELAQLLGCDYAPGVTGIGVVRAMEILADFEGATPLADFREWLLKAQSDDPTPPLPDESNIRRSLRSLSRPLVLPDGFPDARVRRAFLSPDVDAVPDDLLVWRPPDVEALEAITESHLGWSPEHTRRALQPVLDQLAAAAAAPPTIADYFSPASIAGQAGKVTEGSRLDNAVTRVRTVGLAVNSSPEKRPKTSHGPSGAGGFQK